MYHIKNGNQKIAVSDINPGGVGCKTIVLLHGWPLNGRMFEYQVDFLTNLGYRTVCVDLRGFGESDTAASCYSYDKMASDLRTVMDTMPAGCVLCGFSMGAAVALRYMCLYRGYKVSKLCLVAAAAPCFTRRPNFPHGMPREDVDDMIIHAKHDRPGMVTDFMKNFFASCPSDAVRHWFNDLCYDASGLGTIGAARSLRDEDLRPDLCAVNVKTGIFHGKLDKICPYELGEILHSSIPCSRLYPFEYSGHAVFYDESERFNSELLSFLEW